MANAEKYTSKNKEFVNRLLAWFSKNGRHDLPWRQTRDPWHTLIAATLLRKTTTDQAAKMYVKFIEKFATPELLASADPADVKDMLRPLGMEHTRAQKLTELAREIIKRYDGIIPSTLEELKGLPLVGNYTASEVLCVAFGKDEPMVDRNMIRIMQRVFSFTSKKKRPHTDQLTWQFARTLIPPGSGREFNYGIMDFAHYVCKARDPLCQICLINDICDYGIKRLRGSGSVEG